MPDAGILATLLLLLGLFLLGLEFFIPSFGMILIVALLSLLVSFWSACKAWWGTNPAFFWTYVTLLVAGIPGSLMGAVTLLQRTSLGSRFILTPPPVPEKLPPSPMETMTGKSGITQTLMTPGGIVLVEGERMHAESIGMLIEPQTPVIVIGAKANRVVVRPRTPDDDRAVSAARIEQPVTPDNEFLNPGEVSSSGNSDGQPSDDPNGRLDFEIPEDYTGKSQV